jgi:hypothetical protein
MKTDIAEAVLAALIEAEMFLGIAREELAFLTNQAQLRVFAAGCQLTRQGDASRSIHIIMGGRVRVERFHPHLAAPVVLAILGTGEVVAGAEVLGSHLLSTSITAIEDTQTLELDGKALGQAVLKYPKLSVALLHGLIHCAPGPAGCTGLPSDTLSTTFPSGCDTDHRNMPDSEATDSDLNIDGEAAHASSALEAARRDDSLIPALRACPNPNWTARVADSARR